MEDKATILIVDDELGPRESLNMVLKSFYNICMVDSGVKALEIIKEGDIDLAILDLKMPGLQGIDTLREIKKERPEIDVIILTGYGTLKTAVDGIRYGASDYLMKPFNVVEIIAVIRKILEKKRFYNEFKMFLQELGSRSGIDLPHAKRQANWDHSLFEMMKEAMSRPSDRTEDDGSHNYIEFVKVLANTLENKDPYTHGHSSRVNYFSNLIAQKIYLCAEERDYLQIGTYLHDIGKVGIDNKIILKDGKFNEQELEIARRHPEIGVELVKSMGISHQIISVIRHHHEFFDGTGHPDGLKGEEIPLLARIVSVADSFDAMTTDRPYRKAFSIEEAILELRRCAGTQFDPILVESFIEIINEKNESIQKQIQQTVSKVGVA